MKILLVNCIALMTIIWSCNNINSTKHSNESNETFDSFYEKFYKDTVFQKERIKFPLKGEMLIPESQGEYEWQSNSWTSIETIDKDSVWQDGYLYRKSIEKNDSIVVEKIYVPNTGMELVRKFNLVSGKWFLVYMSIANL